MDCLEGTYVTVLYCTCINTKIYTSQYCTHPICCLGLYIIWQYCNLPIYIYIWIAFHPLFHYSFQIGLFLYILTILKYKITLWFVSYFSKYIWLFSWISDFRNSKHWICNCGNLMDGRSMTWTMLGVWNSHHVAI